MASGVEFQLFTRSSHPAGPEYRNLVLLTEPPHGLDFRCGAGDHRPGTILSEQELFQCRVPSIAIQGDGGSKSLSGITRPHRCLGERNQETAFGAIVGRME